MEAKQPGDANFLPEVVVWADFIARYESDSDQAQNSGSELRAQNEDDGDKDGNYRIAG